MPTVQELLPLIVALGLIITTYYILTKKSKKKTKTTVLFYFVAVNSPQCRQLSLFRSNIRSQSF